MTEKRPPIDFVKDMNRVAKSTSKNVQKKYLNSADFFLGYKYFCEDAGLPADGSFTKDQILFAFEKYKEGLDEVEEINPKLSEFVKKIAKISQAIINQKDSQNLTKYELKISDMSETELVDKLEQFYDNREEFVNFLDIYTFKRGDIYSIFNKLKARFHSDQVVLDKYGYYFAEKLINENPNVQRVAKIINSEWKYKANLKEEIENQKRVIEQLKHDLKRKKS